MTPKCSTVLTLSNYIKHMYSSKHFLSPPWESLKMIISASVDNQLFLHQSVSLGWTHLEHKLLSMDVRTSSGVTEKGGSTLRTTDIVPHAIPQTESKWRREEARRAPSIHLFLSASSFLTYYDQYFTFPLPCLCITFFVSHYSPNVCIYNDQI